MQLHKFNLYFVQNSVRGTLAEGKINSENMQIAKNTCSKWL